MVIPLDALLPALLALVALPPVVLGITLLLGVQWREGTEARIAVAHSVLICIGSALLLWAWWRTPSAIHDLALPALLHLDGYHWHPVLLLDWLSALYLALVGLIYPVIVRFSMPSFFREPGRSRYWFLVTLLASSLWLLCIAGNLDTLFAAWELIGACSVLLIGFFRRQIRPGQNSLRALVYYRLGDCLLLFAAVLIHHTFQDQHFRGFAADAATSHAALIAFALLFGSLAKSAQLPMSPWLHRAMEGPAASSAIFYGALSVHLGPFLLLRTSPLWLPEPSVRWTMLGIGLSTAVWSTLVGHTRPDAKTALAYSTMTQIGVMYAELAMGFHTLVAVHLFAHAGLRTWQFLRSSSLIQDFQDNPVFAGSVDLRRRMFFEHLLPAAAEQRLYLAAVRLFWIDALQWHFVARPFLAVFHGVVALERSLLGRPGAATGEPRAVAVPAYSPLLLLLGAAAAAVSWLASSHALFICGLVAVLLVPLLYRERGEEQHRSRLARWLPLLPIGAAVAHGIAPLSEPVAVIALVLVGGAFPCQLCLESVRPRLPPSGLLLLVLAQPGLALAVRLLAADTATLPAATQEALTAWFVLTALVHAGLALVRLDPLRALLAIGGSQSALLVAGALASDHGFGAEYLMLTGTDLGLGVVALLVADLRTRYRIERLAPDHGIADLEPTSARLFLVAGWLFVGLPGGIVFFAEDLVFHALAGHGIAIAAGMIFASVLGAIGFYRVYLGIYAGRPRPGVAATGAMPHRLAAMLLVLVLLTLGLGVWPQLLLGH